MKQLFLLSLVTLVLFSTFATSQFEQTSLQATITVNPVSSVSPNSLSANVLPLSFLEKALFFEHNTDQNVTLILSAEGEISSWVIFSISNFTMEPSQGRIVALFFSVPDTEARIYTGNITASNIIIPVEITVFDKYKLNSSLVVIPAGIQAGNNITIFATIGRGAVGKVKDVEGSIPVVATYQITKGKQVIAEFNTSNEISNVIEESFTIQIPANASNGKYTAKLTASHLNKKTSSKDGFFVGKRNAVGRFLAAIFSILG